MTKLKMLPKGEKKGMDGPEVSFCWNFWLWRLVHQLFAILLVVAGASQSYTDRGPSDCYFIGRGSNSCSPGHVNGLVFYLYVNIFLLQFPLLSVFEAVCLALYQVLTLQIETLTRSWVITSTGRFRDAQFVFQKQTRKKKQQTWWTKIASKYVEGLKSLVLKDVKPEYFTNKTERKNSASCWIKG